MLGPRPLPVLPPLPRRRWSRVSCVPVLAVAPCSWVAVMPGLFTFPSP